jgi:hypothetical protein
MRKFTEDEKNEIFLKYKKILYSVAYRYRHFDRDIEEVRSWGAVGFAESINYYEKHSETPFPTIAFSRIKSAIVKNYIKNQLYNNKSNIQESAVQGKNGDMKSLEEFLVSDEITLTERDLYKIFEEALFEEVAASRNVTIGFFLENRELIELAKENHINLAIAKRYCRRGQTLIKSYLVNNDIIVDFLMHPSEKDILRKKIKKHKPVNSDDFGKIKYLRKFYQYLSLNDIAIILRTSSYAIKSIVEDYPTAEYLKSSVDSSVEKDAIKYIRRWYPEKLASEVTITKMLI